MEDKITPIRQLIAKKQFERDGIREQIRTTEEAIYIDILNESKDKEYAKENNLTNEKGRDIALRERLLPDDVYERLVNMMVVLTSDLETLSIDLERERNVLKIWYVEQLNNVGDKI